jgi:transcriptional regulator with XRE-family HTH domain
MPAVTAAKRKARRPARRAGRGAADPLLGVGARLRHARLIRGFRLKDVAREAGCSESLVSKVENEKLEPSLHVLHKLCGALEIALGELFGDANGGSPITTRPGERPVIELDSLRRGKGIRMERVIPYARGHLLQGNIHIIAPGGSSDGTIAHQGEEVGYVIAGEVELTVNGQSYALSAGDSFCFASHLEHGYRNVGRSEARIFWVNTPPTF